MKEVSLGKFYFVKYFFFGLAVLQLMAAISLLFEFQLSPKNRFAFFVFVALSMILFSIQFIFFSRLHRVTLTKKKICVWYPQRMKRFEWNEVKELKLLPFMNIYALRLRGKKRIYFIAPFQSAALYGMFPAEPTFIPKKLNKV